VNHDDEEQRKRKANIKQNDQKMMVYGIEEKEILKTLLKSSPLPENKESVFTG